jgi:predicted dithiol-disulfide oxidoreductase (DUF899 family)
MSAFTPLPHPPIVSEQEWIVSRRELLWLKVAKQYCFETPDGKVGLADLFDGRSKLIVKHNMLNPNHDVCTGCALEMDHIEGALVHLPHRDVSFAAVSRAPVEQIQAAQRRMGWRARWVSSFRSDFNYDSASGHARTTSTARRVTSTRSGSSSRPRIRASAHECDV